MYDWRRAAASEKRCAEKGLADVAARHRIADDWLTRRGTRPAAAAAAGKRVSRRRRVRGQGREGVAAVPRLDAPTAVPPRRPTGIGRLTSRRSDRRRGASRRGRRRWDFGPPTARADNDFTIINVLLSRDDRAATSLTHAFVARFRTLSITFFFFSTFRPRSYFKTAPLALAAAARTSVARTK